MDRALLVRELGLADYRETWQAMGAFTDSREADTPDELWLLEHPRVFTLGRAGRLEHLLNPGDIPVIHTDRGGQVTYHGPGQLVAYLLLDLNRLGMGVRRLVKLLEQSVIDFLEAGGVTACRQSGAPGVYVDGKKIAALGLRVRRGYTYHGLALNVHMNLEPYQRINPCGQVDQKVTQLADLGIAWGLPEAASRLHAHMVRVLGYAPGGGIRR